MEASLRINRGSFQSTRGKTFSYEDYITDENDFPILFLHGWQSSPRFYHALVRNLDDSGIRCILIELDMEEKDASPASLKSTSNQHAIDIQDLLEHLDIDEFGLLAFSMFGGSIAHRLAMLALERLKFLILLSPGPCLIDSTPRHVFWNMLPDDIKSDILELDGDFLNSIINKVAHFIQDGLKSRSSKNGSKAFIVEDLKKMIEEVNFVKDFDPGSNKFITDIPVQIICGELDEFIPPVLSYKVSRIFKEIFFQVIPFGGHYFPLDFPGETARLIKEFLEKIM